MVKINRKGHRNTRRKTNWKRYRKTHKYVLGGGSPSKSPETKNKSRRRVTITRSTRERVAKSIQKIQKEKAEATKKAIAEALTKHEENLENYLKKICDASHYCTAFGRDTERIRRFFNNFPDLSYINKTEMKVLSQGANGEVLYAPMKKNTYSHPCVIKYALAKKSDNMFYEGFVGEYINKNFYNYYPCFLESYGVYKNLNNEASVLRSSPQLADSFERMTPNKYDFSILNSENMNIACKSQKNLALLCEFVNNPITFHKRYSSRYQDTAGYTDFARFMVNYIFTGELFSSLFQIYAPLAHMVNEFTHYDLHTGNAVLYSIPDINGIVQYVIMNYHLPNGKVITLKTNKIAKIFDYGRCFTTNTNDFYREMCRTKECIPSSANKPIDLSQFDLLYPNSKHMDIDTKRKEKAISRARDKAMLMSLLEEEKKAVQTLKEQEIQRHAEISSWTDSEPELERKSRIQSQKQRQRQRQRQSQTQRQTQTQRQRQSTTHKDDRISSWTDSEAEDSNPKSKPKPKSKKRTTKTVGVTPAHHQHPQQKIQEECAFVEKGFSFWNENLDKDNYYISARNYNKSHDLILANIIKNVILHYTSHITQTSTLDSQLKILIIDDNLKIIDSIPNFMIDLLNCINYEDRYGTPSIDANTNITTSGSDLFTHNKINNVVDMFNMLVEIYDNYFILRDIMDKRFNDKIGKDLKLYGTLDIWLDRSREMKFTMA